MTDIKIPKKVLAARDLFEVQRTADNQHRNITRVANSPLPFHKGKKFEDLLANAYVAKYNASMAFKQAYEKLNDGNQRLLTDLVRGKIHETN